MNIRSWLSAALVVSLVSIAAAPSLADSRASAERYQAPPARRAAAAQMEAPPHIAQARSARAVRVEPPAPARVKQAKLEPRPRQEGARQAAKAEVRNARMRH